MSADFNQLDNFFTTSSPKKDDRPRFSFLKKLREFFPTKQQFFYLPNVLSKTERRMIVGLFLIAILSLVAIPVSAYYHGTAPIADYGGSWSEGMVGIPQHINPLLLQTNDADSDLVHLIYAGLLRYDHDGVLIPDLAESYSVSDDGLEYTFVLKENLEWHDGQALTVDDVIFTIATTQNSDYGSTQRINWQGVEVTKKDEKTVVFRLKNRYAQFINNTTLGILPEHVWETTKGAQFSLSESNLKPIGAGPYKLSGTPVRDGAGYIRSLKLAAFDEYALGKPYVESITLHFYDSEQKAITALNQGEVEGLSFVSAQNLSLLKNKNITVQHLKLPRYFGIFFNQSKSKQLSEQKVRIALNHATDKQALIERILDGSGTVVDSPLLPGIVALTDAANPYPFDLEKAKKILDDAGWKPGEDGIRMKDIKVDGKTETLKLEVEITTSNWPELVSVANEIQAQWKSVGVQVAVKSLSVSEIQQAIKERNYSALLFGEVLGLDPDPFSFWHSTQKKDPGLNLALYDKKEADVLLEQARQTLDPEKRKQTYAQLQTLIMADAPAVLLYSPDYLYVQPDDIRNNTLESIGIPSNRFDTVHTWYIDTKRIKK